jgi:hypothetical protein
MYSIYVIKKYLFILFLLNTSLGFDAVADGNDDVEIIILCFIIFPVRCS